MKTMTPSDFVRGAQLVGIVMLIALMSACCLGGGGVSSVEQMRACHEICGEYGVQSWDNMDGCQCRTVILPNYCIDRCDIYCADEFVDVD